MGMGPGIACDYGNITSVPWRVGAAEEIGKPSDSSNAAPRHCLVDEAPGMYGSNAQATGSGITGGPSRQSAGDSLPLKIAVF